MLSKTALISIHPNHVTKILSGEKRLEFRRKWATKPVERLLIYSTAPSSRLVAVVRVRQIITGSPTALWKHAQEIGGGISRRKLLEYLEGVKSAFALELHEVCKLGDGVAPSVVFGQSFQAPQSFRYLNQQEEARLNKLIV